MENPSKHTGQRLRNLDQKILFFKESKISNYSGVSEKYVLLALQLTVINRKHGLIFLKEKARFLIENF